MDFKIQAIGLATLFIKRYLGPFRIRYNAIKKSQWYSKEELDNYQFILLKNLIRHCYKTVPYYRQFMDQNRISINQINTIDDLKLFPILTKQDILAAGDSLISKKYPKFITKKAYTGGTTGTPLILHRDLFSIGNEHAFLRRQWDWAGIKKNDSCAYLTGRLLLKPDDSNHKLYAYDYIMKELILSTYHLSKDTAGGYLELIKKYNVKAIIGYPSAVNILAQHCIDTGFELQVESVLTSSEILTQSMKCCIQKAFNCKVFDYYGSAERICMIQTCEHGNYHVIPEFGLTEFIPLDQKNSPGEYRIISTGFWNMSMPLIRYELGDIAVINDKECTCGRSFDIIDAIKGRKGDSIKTRSGKEFGSAILTHLLYGTDHILESQIIQNDLDRIIINYVPTENFSLKDLNSFKSLIIKHLPSELSVELNKVDRIQRTSSGKIQPVISNLS